MNTRCTYTLQFSGFYTHTQPLNTQLVRKVRRIENTNFDTSLYNQLMKGCLIRCTL